MGGKLKILLDYFPVMEQQLRRRGMAVSKHFLISKSLHQPCYGETSFCKYYIQWCKKALIEIIEDRHGKSSTIISSQIPISKWKEIIGEQTIADAIFDRIVHDAHRLEMKGESLSKKKQPAEHDEIDILNSKN